MAIKRVIARRYDEAICPITTNINLKLMSRTQNKERDSVVMEKIASSYLLAMTSSIFVRKPFYFKYSYCLKYKRR